MTPERMEIPLKRTRSAAASKRRRSIFIPWERPPRWVGMVTGRSGIAVTLASLAIVTAIVSFRHQRRIEGARATRVTIAAIQEATVRFQFDHGRCPSGLGELVRPPQGQPYLDEIPTDAWGRSLEYRCPGRKHPLSADVRSRGPDGSWWGRDNVE